MEPRKGARPEDGTGRLGRGEKDLSIFREAGLREEVRGVDGKGGGSRERRCRGGLCYLRI